MVNFGKWSDPSVPHKGWACTYIEDLGSPDQTCEMCEKEHIRYVHYMSHPDYPGELQCGCICAGNMEANLVAAQNREAKLRNRSSRKRNWPKLRGWHTSVKGNLTMTKDGYRITLFKSGQGFKASVVELTKNVPFYSKRIFKLELEAQSASFDQVEHMKENN